MLIMGPNLVFSVMIQMIELWNHLKSFKMDTGQNKLFTTPPTLNFHLLYRFKNAINYDIKHLVNSIW